MGQVSGSISLDMTKIQREITATVGEEVAKVVMPALAQLSAQVDRLTPDALGEEDMVATLACYLPAGASTEMFPTARKVAEFQSERLREMGYALVPVAGPALEVAQRAKVARDPVAAAVARADARLAEATRNGPEDSWFEGQD